MPLSFSIRSSDNFPLAYINTYELLIDEVRRGTGFENGKQRVLDFYNNNQPTAKELAAFLKKEYGIGGHSGSGNVLMVGSDSKGITFDLRSGAKYTHSWLNVAYAVETQILENPMTSLSICRMRSLSVTDTDFTAFSVTTK